MFRKLLFATASLAMAAPADAATQAIIVGNLIPDAASGPTGPAVILIEDGRIKDIAKGRNNPFQADSIVDLSSKTIVPGLIDLHVHLTGDPGGDFRDEAIDPDEWGVVMGVKNAALTVKAGMTPTEALASATTIAAKTLGMENEIGRIAVAYSADLVAVAENPLSNIRTLEKPDWVMVRGRIVP